MNNYIAITIGPIFNTMSMTSSPLAIWASSYVFSVLSKTLCRLIVENGVKEESIVSPYYSKDDNQLNQSDGIGLFHDRIIFNAEGFDIEKLTEIKENALEEISRLLGVNYNYMQEYVMISAVGFEADNPIIGSAKMLDCLELAKPYVYKDSSPLLRLFSGKGNSHNNELEKTELVRSVSDFQLRGADGFKSIEDIVDTGKEYKKHKYYAIVRSDGDNMSNIIASLGSDAKIRDFSQDCLVYCRDIANLVKNYGGITIYSGGDDLLAILPCETTDGRTPFDFVRDANSVFKKAFEKYNKPVSLSFGITMAYYKFPLFEALDDSYYLLAEVAKQSKSYPLVNEEKNRLAVRLQKNAGQSEGLLISNRFLDEFLLLLTDIKRNCADKKTNSDVILSVMHKFVLFEEIFNNLDDEKQIVNAVENVFDADVHKQSSFVSYKLIDLMTSLKKEIAVAAITDDGVEIDNYSETMNYILRICKFFVEKGGEE